MKPIAILVCVLLALSSGVALAQSQEQEEAVTEVVAPRTEMVLTGANIEGELPKPSAQYWVSKRKVRFDSQIRVRQNFLPELMGSAGAL